MHISEMLKINFLDNFVYVLDRHSWLGTIHKLRRRARGGGGLPNVYATT